jgi:hypothetical protein
MTPTRHDEVTEDRQSLWLLTASPSIWAVHFLVSYTVGALWCGKLAGPGAGLGSVHAVIIGLALAALAGVGYTGWLGWRKHRHGGTDPPYDRDTPEDRHRFLGFATVLLSALSAVSIVYVAVAAVLIRSCR